jgi:ribosomal protein S18 acetylase RimI-like enzyme
MPHRGGLTIEKPTADSDHEEGSVGGTRGPLRLSEFSWDGFVRNGGLFVNLVGGALAGGIVLTTPDSLPRWMISSVDLLFLSMALAFTRVWKTAREERETSGLWDQLGATSPRGSGMDQVKDAVFEIPYLFSMVFLPASVVSLQTFAGCLLLFYMADNYYNIALIRGVAAGRESRREVAASVDITARRLRRAAGRRIHRFTGGRMGPVLSLLGSGLGTAFSIPDPHAQSIDRAVLVRYFRRRAQLDRLAIWLLAGCLALASVGSRDWAGAAGTLVVLALLVMELVVEPFRTLGLHYQADEAGDPSLPGDDEASAGLLLWTAPPGGELDDESVTALRRIHEEAFPPAERQYDVPFMLHATGRHGFRLLLLTQPVGPVGAHVVVGYVFLQARPDLETAYLWYLAIDSERRKRGFGRTMVKLALESVLDGWPSIRAVFLESGPGPRRFYRDLGFWWVRGLDYVIPAEGDPARSLGYDPMYLPLHGSDDDLDDRFVSEAVLEMARDNFRARRDDPRWKNLRESASRMRRVSPASPEDA